MTTNSKTVNGLKTAELCLTFAVITRGQGIRNTGIKVWKIQPSLLPIQVIGNQSADLKNPGNTCTRLIYNMFNKTFSG